MKSLRGQTEILSTAFQLVVRNGLSGHYYQYGIGDGGGVIAATEISKTLSTALEEEFGIPSPLKDMRSYLFDLKKDESVQNHIVSTGVPPELLHVDINPTLTSRDPLKTKSALIVHISLDNDKDVKRALDNAETTFQVGTVIIIDKWWKLDRKVRVGFDRWIDSYIIFRDFDNYLEVYQDNGWARAFVVKKLVQFS